VLEALYLLAVAKSPRVRADVELMRHDAEGKRCEHTQVSASLSRGRDPARVQIDLSATETARRGRKAAEPFADEEDGAPAKDTLYVQKALRVNGAPRKVSELIGEFNAVLFSPADMDLVYGPPAGRRRYLDILLSQQERAYLRALQRYQRVLTQRNHLLKRVREGASRAEELGLWDDKLVAEGGAILARRLSAVRALSEMGSEEYGALSSAGEAMRLEYVPSVALDRGPMHSEEAAVMLRRAISSSRRREVSAGFTLVGPHRDDLRLLVGEADAAQYASRGQARTAVLALRLAEGQFLAKGRGEAPVLLLDDVMSELDKKRRRHVLEQAAGYEQAFITTAELELIEAEGIERVAYYSVRDGRLEKGMGSRV